MSIVDRRSRLIAAGLLLALATAACGSARYVGVGHPLTVPQLEYRLIDQIGRPLFCGPPVVRVPTPAEAQQEAAALQASDPATFAAIVARLHLDAAHLSTDDDRNILQQAEILNALPLQPQGQDYRFDYIAARSTPEHVSGSIDSSGGITLERHDQVTFPGPGGCPICLAAQDRIAAPGGPIQVSQLRPGMRVFSLDAAGRRIAVTVLEVRHTRAPLGHMLVRLMLMDGRQVEVSPGHPTADGRQMGELRAGDPFDGSRVASAVLVAYAGDTWDLLPDGPTHAYWANDVLLESTLASR